MSGIYIPGMEIPKEHGVHKIRLFVREDGTASIWGLEEYIPHEPLEVIPVQPHGRLIDADALIETLNNNKIPYNDDVNYFLMNAPTIIPAE